MAQQIVLITGATTGIGKESALRFAREGFRVFATGRNKKALDALFDASAGKLEIVELDVTDRESIARAAAEIASRTDGYGVDVLVNNAGYGTVGPTMEVTDEDIRGQYDTNVFGLVAVTQVFARAMMLRGRGRVINVSSLGGKVTLPMFGAYNSTKFAVESLSDALRRELAAFGVKVVLIEPGPIKTEFSKRSVRDLDMYRKSALYGRALERADAMKERADAMSAPASVVVDAIRKGMTSSWPRARYVVPFSSRVMGWLAWLAPTWMLDFVLTRALGLTRKGLGLDATALPAAASAKG